MNTILLLLSSLKLFYKYTKLITLLSTRLLNDFITNTVAIKNCTNIYIRSSLHKPTHFSFYNSNFMHYLYILKIYICVTLYKYNDKICYNEKNFLKDANYYIIYLNIVNFLRREYVFYVFILFIISVPWSTIKNITLLYCLSFSYYINSFYNLSHYIQCYDHFLRFREVIGYSLFYIHISSRQILRRMCGVSRTLDLTIYYIISCVCEFINVTSSNRYLNFFVCNG